jgi:hypothetical protein
MGKKYELGTQSQAELNKWVASINEAIKSATDEVYK